MSAIPPDEPPPRDEDAPPMRQFARVLDLPEAYRARRPVWDRITVTDMLVPLPPVPWVVEALEIAPGAPTLVAGYGYSGKTIAMQSLAIAVASGGLVWGRFTCRQGRVVHVDHEQGRRLTIDRYQRLFRATNADLEPNALNLVVMPSTYIDTPAAEDLYKRELDGHALALVDSFRAAAPSTEENDSNARKSLDMLSRVSDATGCAIAVIHHARKESPGFPGAPSSGKMMVRGSSAIFDACQSVISLSAQKGEPTRLDVDKARITGRFFPTRTLRLVDVGLDDNPRWGLRVECEDARLADAAHSQAKLDALCERILATVRQKPGASGRAVMAMIRASGVEARTTDVGAGLDILRRDGAVVQRKGGKAGAVLWYPTSPNAPADEE
jgi:hypothetical protein